MCRPTHWGFAKIFNLSLSQSLIPPYLKSDTIIPLKKKKLNDDLSWNADTTVLVKQAQQCLNLLIKQLGG